MIFFFKQKTAYEMRISDWSSDVCSSDLLADVRDRRDRLRAEAKAHSSGGGVSPVSSISDSPGNAPCSASDLDILAAAEENSVKLEAWQKIGRASCRERVGQYV